MFIQIEENSVGGVVAYVKEQPSPTIFLCCGGHLGIGKSVQFRAKYIENG